MHTGCSKNGIIVMAPFILKPKRYLIISPDINKLVADLDPASPSNFCYSKNVIKREVDGGKALPKFMDAKKIRRGASKLAPVSEEICLVGVKQGLELIKLNQDTFDLIAIDAAHHVPADIWMEIIEHFKIIV